MKDIYGEIRGMIYDSIYFEAITPKDNPVKILESYGVTKLNGFIEPYSRWDNVISAFTSHFSIWQEIASKKKGGFIFEHDAVVIDSLPIMMKEKSIDEQKTVSKIKIVPHHLLRPLNIVNIGHPSYGKYNTPANIGINPLTSKRYFPGAHAYYVSPEGAKELIHVAKREAGPTDVFINYRRFPNLYEWYPWPVIAKDNFSTIQNVNGCQAKHGYNPERYKLVQVQ
jgi:GR25 family glycosyltransferase involved in LPS biosynthesis